MMMSTSSVLDDHVALLTVRFKIIEFAVWSCSGDSFNFLNFIYTYESEICWRRLNYSRCFGYMFQVLNMIREVLVWCTEFIHSLMAVILPGGAPSTTPPESTQVQRMETHHAAEIQAEIDLLSLFSCSADLIPILVNQQPTEFSSTIPSLRHVAQIS